MRSQSRSPESTWNALDTTSRKDRESHEKNRCKTRRTFEGLISPRCPILVWMQGQGELHDDLISIT